MRMAINTYRPASNPVTTLLLILVITGFGMFAQYRIDAGSHGLAASTGELVIARTGK